MSSTTVSIRIDSVIKKRLEKLVKSTGRSRSFLAAEAISEYVDLNEWQVAGNQKAMVSLIAGRGFRMSGSVGLPFASQEVLAQRTHDKAGRQHGPEEEQAPYDRVHHFMQQEPELEPKPIEWL